MDLIERQAVKEHFHMYVPGLAWDKIDAIIEDIPSAQPTLATNLQPTCNQLATDCISRQAVIDAFCKECYYTDGEICDRDDVCGNVMILKALPSAQPKSELITWILDKIWDEDMWELNWQAFPEILCRKLAKLGYLEEKDGEYERLDRQTGGD